MCRRALLSKAVLLCSLVVFLGVAANADSIFNIDELPITNPNDPNNNVQSWAWVPDSCLDGCHATSNITQNTSVNLDGRSIQFDFNKLADGCTINCYTDTYNFNRAIFGSAANDANSLTLDLYAALDARGLTGSQALEFNIEQDTQIGANLWSRAIYGVQCDYKGSGLWRVWDGGIGNGDWVATGVNCTAPNRANTFDHYVFNFSRINGNQIEYDDFFINGNEVVLGYLTHGVQTVTDWHDQLVAAIQLDGDSKADSYSVFADRIRLEYTRVPEPGSLLLFSAGAIGLFGTGRKRLRL